MKDTPLDRKFHGESDSGTDLGQFGQLTAQIRNLFHGIQQNPHRFPTKSIQIPDLKIHMWGEPVFQPTMISALQNDPTTKNRSESAKSSNFAIEMADLAKVSSKLDETFFSPDRASRGSATLPHILPNFDNELYFPIPMKTAAQTKLRFYRSYQYPTGIL